MTGSENISFRVPDGWNAQSAEYSSIPGLDFVAVFSESDQGFTPNITFSTEPWADDSGIEGIADISARQLKQKYPDVVVEHRKTLGSARAPGIAQRLRFTAPIDGKPVELSQTQIILSLTPSGQPGGMVVVETAFTVTVRQMPSLLADFETFVGSIRLAE